MLASPCSARKHRVIPGGLATSFYGKRRYRVLLCEARHLDPFGNGHRVGFARGAAAGDKTMYAGLDQAVDDVCEPLVTDVAVGEEWRDQGVDPV